METQSNPALRNRFFRRGTHITETLAIPKPPPLPTSHDASAYLYTIRILITTMSQPTKRTRIDPTASANNNNKSKGNNSTTGNNTNLTPTATAKKSIKDHCESLSPQLAPILARVAHEHLLLLIKRHSKMAQATKQGKVTALDPTNAEAMANLELSDIPRSARLNFKVTAPKEVMEDPEFLQLKQVAENYIKTVHHKLTGFVKQSTDIQIKHANSDVDKSLASSFYIIATAVITNSDNSEDAHKIVNSILDAHHESVLKNATTNTLAAFRNNYKLLHNLTDLPNPENVPARSPARRGAGANAAAAAADTGRGESLFPELVDPPNPPALRAAQPTNPQPRTPLHTSIINVKRLFEQLLNYPYEVYLACQKEADKMVALKKLETTIFTTKATEDSAMVVDGENAPSPELLKEMIRKESQRSNAGLQKKINQLEKDLKKARSPNATRGRSHSARRSSASKQKQNANTNGNNRGSSNQRSRRRSTSGSRPPNPNNRRGGTNRRGKGKGKAAGSNRDSGNDNRDKGNNRSRKSSTRSRSNSRRASNRPRDRSNRN